MRTAQEPNLKRISKDMNQKSQSPKGAYITLAGGFAVGAVCVGSMFSGATVSRAHAQPEPRPTPAVVRSAGNVAGLRVLDESFADLVDFAAPAVVNIKSGTAQQPRGQGSGFIIRADGYIVTNDHVVEGAETVTVTLKNGREYQGTVKRGDQTDIAVVKIEAKNLPTLQFADSAKIRPGQYSVAIGSPFGLENTVTVGHVSAIGRHQNTDIGGRQYPDLVQTDAAINMGNSGGPLLNINGQVIGVNTSIFSMTGANQGIAFAIPSNQAKFVSDMLMQKGRITRSMLGVGYQDLREYQLQELGLPGGARVEQVYAGGPAAAAGLQKEDVIVRVGSVPILKGADLPNTMMTNAPGTTVPVEVVRSGARKTFQVKLVPFKDVTRPTRPAEGEGQPNRRRRAPGGSQEMPRIPDELRQFFDGDPAFPSFPGPSEEEGDDVPPLRGDGSARLGVRAGDISDELRARYGIPKDVQGAVVDSVEPGSVAARLGLRPGDVVQEVAGKRIKGATDLVEAMKGVQWGQKRRVKFGRYGKGSVSIQERDVTFR